MVPEADAVELGAAVDSKLRLELRVSLGFGPKKRGLLARIWQMLSCFCTYKVVDETNVIC